MTRTISEEFFDVDVYIEKRGENDYLRIPFADSFGIDLKIDGKIYKDVTNVYSEDKIYVGYDRVKREYISETIPKRWKIWSKDKKLASTDLYFTPDQMLAAKAQYRKAKQLNKILPYIGVGDFVQFSGQRDSSSWRKVITIDWDNYQIFGHKYSEPEEGYDMRFSSDNGMQFLKRLIKADGTVIV